MYNTKADGRRPTTKPDRPTAYATTYRARLRSDFDVAFSAFDDSVTVCGSYGLESGTTMSHASCRQNDGHHRDRAVDAPLQKCRIAISGGWLCYPLATVHVCRFEIPSVQRIEKHECCCGKGQANKELRKSTTPIAMQKCPGGDAESDALANAAHPPAEREVIVRKQHW